MPVDKDEFIIPRLSTLQPIEEQLGRGFPTFIDPEYVSDWEGMNIKPILSNTEAMEFECGCIANPNRMRELLGMPSLGTAYSMSFTCNSPVLVPVRKHRKKRIAKKWAKRYGYKYVLVPKRLDSVSLVNDNEIDILGRKAEIICDA